MKKEKKIQIREELRQYKEARKARQAALKAMSPADRKAAKVADRLLRKKAKHSRKEQIKTMNRSEQRAAKQHDRYFKRLVKRPRRYVTGGLLALVFGMILISVAPILGDIANILSLNIDTTTPDATTAINHGKEVAEEVSNEGMVLLKNENNLLPLQNEKINVFGFSAFNFAFGGGGSGGSSSAYTTNLFDGLSLAGIEYNETLHDFYKESKYYKEDSGSSSIIDMLINAVVGKDEEKEPDISYLTDSAIAQAVSYSDTALLVISSEAIEAADSSLDILKMGANMKALVEVVDEHFDHIVVLVNSGQQMELGFLDTYEHIDAALWVGTPGSQGALSIGNILKGNINPSGHLTDTFAYDVSSAPSNENVGDFKYTNLSGMGSIEYEESIYIGYRYYETRYLGNEAGYNEAVQYPFGYGLSYTSFDWNVIAHSFTLDTISVTVRVQNTGTTYSGKDVVQVYFSAPYTPGGIEKSAIELAAYAKTDLLGPGESQDLIISFPTRDMSSYDMNEIEAYIVEKGTYQIHVSNNVHDAVETLSFNLGTDLVYHTDEVTGTAIHNQFDYANGGLTYLSRNDWAGTYPSISDINLTASQELIDNFNARPEVTTGEMPTTGADNGIQLEDLVGLPFDDPQWDAFLDQFTVDELKELISTGAYVTKGIDRLGVPSTTLLDGPAGINFVFASYNTMAYPTEIVIASTWNDELAFAIGEAIGMECNAYGIDGWYAPGQNLHRSPQGGRNFEYFSEDPLVSGKMSAGMVRGGQSRNIIVTMKHFVLNEQETNARSGVLVWTNEQALRELYLRPFEITVKEAHVTGVMSSFIHVGYKWSGGNPELLQNVLRGEWGFVGLVTTDAVLGSFMDLQLAIHNGNDLMLAMIPSGQEKKFDKIYKQDPVGTLIAARERVHNICYAIANYTGALV